MMVEILTTDVTVGSRFYFLGMAEIEVLAGQSGVTLRLGTSTFGGAKLT
jgi:hypothetical protein